MPLYDKEQLIKHVKTMLKVQGIHNTVWTYRDFLHDQWTTPPPQHCVLFALTEYGEVIDADLRNFPEYQRNNKDKNLDVMGEIADMAIMTASALGPDLDRASSYPEKGMYDTYTYYMDAVHDAGGKLLWVAKKYDKTYPTAIHDQLVSALGTLAASIPNLDKLVVERMEGLHRKHGKEVTV